MVRLLRGFDMKKYRTSRFRQLIFPQELLIDQSHVLTRKRRFPAFWVVTEESIPLSKLASIQIHRGLFFSKIIIENSGGPYPIVVDGLWNNTAREARDLLETIERELMKSHEIAALVDESGRDGGNSDRDGDGGGGHPPNPGPRNNPSKSVERTDNDDSDSRNYASTQGPILDYSSDSRNHHSQRHGVNDELVNKLAQQTSRKFGEIPSDDWNPPAPWESGSHAESRSFSADPGEYSQDSAAKVSVVDRKPVRKKASAVEQLNNWWNRATTNVYDGDPREVVRGRKKPRKLN